MRETTASAGGAWPFRESPVPDLRSVVFDMPPNMVYY